MPLIDRGGQIKPRARAVKRCSRGIRRKLSEAGLFPQDSRQFTKLCRSGWNLVVYKVRHEQLAIVGLHAQTAVFPDALRERRAAMADKKSVIVTGASRGIGAAVTRAFLDRGYNVVATSRTISRDDFAPSAQLALVDGDIGQADTAQKVAAVAVKTFGTIDHVVNNAGIFYSKPFTGYTAEDFHSFVSINLEGFLLITQLAVKQMLAQGAGGSVTTITAALADNPMVGSPASVPMMTKGGLNTITRSLAMEYARDNIRFNAVAPGQVDTALHEETPKEVMKTLSPMGTIADANDIAEAVVYLVEARCITGEVLHVDGGAHLGRW
jgi:NAD(P)-dependent dehydrogenase (short-subunit alcohol dehydrogenase family)